MQINENCDTFYFRVGHCPTECINGINTKVFNQVGDIADFPDFDREIKKSGQVNPVGFIPQGVFREEWFILNFLLLYTLFKY